MRLNIADDEKEIEVDWMRNKTILVYLFVKEEGCGLAANIAPPRFASF
jgi:hypothetical protein